MRAAAVVTRRRGGGSSGEAKPRRRRCVLASSGAWSSRRKEQRGGRRVVERCGTQRRGPDGRRREGSPTTPCRTGTQDGRQLVQRAARGALLHALPGAQPAIRRSCGMRYIHTGGSGGGVEGTSALRLTFPLSSDPPSCRWLKFLRARPPSCWRSRTTRAAQLSSRGAIKKFTLCRRHWTRGAGGGWLHAVFQSPRRARGGSRDPSSRRSYLFASSLHPGRARGRGREWLRLCLASVSRGRRWGWGR